MIASKALGKKIGIALIAAALALLSFATAHAQNAGGLGAIQGQMYSADEGRTPQSFPIIVVPASTAQPLVLEDHASEGDLSQLATLPAQRSGAGAVRPDGSGEYSVTGLADGEYLVVAYAAFADAYQSPPPEEIAISADGDISIMRGFVVTVQAGASVNVDFVFALPEPSGTSTLRVCMTTFDRDTLEQGPDPITALEIEPNEPGIEVIIQDDGCVLLLNIPPGTYTLTIETARGFRRVETITVGPGENGELTLGAAPPETGVAGELPASGGGHSGASSSLTMALIGLFALAASSVLISALGRWRAG